ncbi:hypothetical protein NDU88_003432 [Pleurodeles waltl]|uniref:Uncharacterized protein n=1 Tax=Pleurodeles waltl TaxID=8319 RepID=A0AAV7W2C7_PLEWA|nr:hypothetical protein NDU88_003432 [Pleurodeles waltl]
MKINVQPIGCRNPEKEGVDAAQEERKGRKTLEEGARQEDEEPKDARGKEGSCPVQQRNAMIVEPEETGE